MVDLLLKFAERLNGTPLPAASPNGNQPSAIRQKVLFDVVAVGLEQHVGAAQLADLLLGALDHAVALARLRVEDLSGPRHLEALLGARLGLDLGHLALLWREARALRPPKMLINERVCVSTSPPPRQPLISRAAGRARLWQSKPIMAISPCSPRRLWGG